jgi:hypothetical protein
MAREVAGGDQNAVLSDYGSAADVNTDYTSLLGQYGTMNSLVSTDLTNYLNQILPKWNASANNILNNVASKGIPLSTFDNAIAQQASIPANWWKDPTAAAAPDPNMAGLNYGQVGDALLSGKINYTDLAIAGQTGNWTVPEAKYALAGGDINLPFAQQLLPQIQASLAAQQASQATPASVTTQAGTPLSQTPANTNNVSGAVNSLIPTTTDNPSFNQQYPISTPTAFPVNQNQTQKF